MAGSSASGRSPPPDGGATGKSGLGPLEALWKHEAEKRCAIPTDRAQRGLGSRIGKCRKLRKNSRFRVIVHGSFDTAHNLKVVGSNPTPATKSLRYQMLMRRPPGRRVRFQHPWKHCGSKIGRSASYRFENPGWLLLAHLTSASRERRVLFSAFCRHAHTGQKSQF
jgi:hypothetical protein